MSLARLLLVPGKAVGKARKGRIDLARLLLVLGKAPGKAGKGWGGSAQFCDSGRQMGPTHLIFEFLVQSQSPNLQLKTNRITPAYFRLGEK